MQMIFHKGSFSTKDCVLGCENPQTLQAHLGLSNLGFDHWGVNFLSWISFKSDREAAEFFLVWLPFDLIRQL